MKEKRIKPIYRIILTIPIYIAIMYKSYNFQINAQSIIFTLICLLIVSIDLYLYNKNVNPRKKN